MNKILTSAMLAAAVALGTSASAAVVVFTPTSVAPAPSTKIFTIDIDAGQFVSASEVILPGESLEFVFTAKNAITISDIAFSGTGNNGGTDLGNIEFGLTPATTNVFTPVVTGNSAFGGLSLPGFSVPKGGMFTIYAEDGVMAPVTFGYSFSTTAVPVPAALPLLIGGIATLGAVARKKKTKTA